MLAPAGNRIKLGFNAPLKPVFDGYKAIWLNSGTAALALSVLISKKIKNISNPEVIIPAYTCPDLVAACAHAGVKCRLCDLDQNNTGYSLENLETLINDNTIAIIAINFLGIQERLFEISEMAKKNNVFLIEDNAQWYPELNHTESLFGDFVCLSFGRGKPVSLLGGGCILIKNSIAENQTIEDRIQTLAHQKNEQNNFIFFAKGIIYNCMINPYLYSLIKYIPGLKIGQTIYKPLTSTESMDKTRESLLGINITKYTSTEPTAQLYLQTHLDNISDDIISLPNKFLGRTKRLLRFPILMEDHVAREDIIDKFNTQGLGASRLYNHILPEIPGTQAYLLEYDDLPNAADFANRLITLPVHNLVNKRHLDKMIEILSSK